MMFPVNSRSVRLCAVLVLVFAGGRLPAARPSVYVWFEPEWFDGVEGAFAYWPGPQTYRASGHWGIAGPGISAEWTQGGESEWNSMGVPPQETHAECWRDFVVPRSGHYKVWVRYYDHRNQQEPFRVMVTQQGRAVINGELGVQPAVSPNDEYALYWGFAFAWGGVEGELDAGPAQLRIAVDRAGENFRQVDAVLLTDDAGYQPIGREKPPFAYTQTFADLEPAAANWRGSANGLKVGDSWRRRQLGGTDFAIWVTVGTDKKWWSEQNIDTLTLNQVLFQFGPPRDITQQFHDQFAETPCPPVLCWQHYLPGFYLGEVPDLSADAPLYRWLARTGTPFYVMTNYASPVYTESNGPATYKALSQSLAEQFLGFIHGEALGSLTVRFPAEQVGSSRREHIDACGEELLKAQAAEWSRFFKTSVPESFRSTSIACLSCDSTALAHMFLETGARCVAYELDATNLHVPMRIAFLRGAARQYGGAWLNYASGNFGDACNYFSQKPVVPRGAPSWWHSKYAVTDGVSAAWYRKLYYLNYLGGASAIFWEQGLANQWIQPGPGTHPIQLSPFGRGTEEFEALVDRLPDRGEPYTPVALLLSYGNGYDRVNNTCKMLGHFREDRNDLELRELFNVLWYPSGVLEGQPQMPDVQSMPSGRYGNIFDVLVDRPARAAAIFDYPVVWAAGDADLAAIAETLADYVRRGGTLVLNIAAAAGLSADFLGLSPSGRAVVADQWCPVGGQPRDCVPFEVATVDGSSADPLVWATPGTPLITRHQVGEGAVILTLMPHLLGQDERAHPSLPYLVDGLTADLLPVQVLLSDGSRPQGEVMYQINRTRDGWLVALLNNRGIDKTQNGVARVDRRQFVDVLVRTRLDIRAALEYTQPRELTISAEDAGVRTIALRVEAGDVQVIGLQSD